MNMNIEKVQIRALKIPDGFCNPSGIFERLKILNITSIKDKRIRGDLIEMYKVIRVVYEKELTKSPLLKTDIELTGTG